MARILIGNVKGPIGATGPVGPRGPEGPQGIQGPLCPLTNNALATVPGVAALDAVMGKTLSDKDAALQNEVTKLNSELSVKTGVVDANTGAISVSYSTVFACGDITSLGIDVVLKNNCLAHGFFEAAYLPVDYRPRVDIVINVITHDGLPAVVRVGSNGIVGITAGQNALPINSVIRFSTAYMTV